MKKRIYRRAVRIAAEIFARAEFCIVEDVRVCEGATETMCTRCIRDYFIRKAKEALRREVG